MNKRLFLFPFIMTHKDILELWDLNSTNHFFLILELGAPATVRRVPTALGVDGGCRALGMNLSNLKTQSTKTNQKKRLSLSQQFISQLTKLNLMNKKYSFFRWFKIHFPCESDHIIVLSSSWHKSCPSMSELRLTWRQGLAATKIPKWQNQHHQKSTIFGEGT